MVSSCVESPPQVQLRTSLLQCDSSGNLSVQFEAAVPVNRPINLIEGVFDGFCRRLLSELTKDMEPAQARLLQHTLGEDVSLWFAKKWRRGSLVADTLALGYYRITQSQRLPGLTVDFKIESTRPVAFRNALPAYPDVLSVSLNESTPYFNGIYAQINAVTGESEVKLLDAAEGLSTCIWLKGTMNLLPQEKEVDLGLADVLALVHWSARPGPFSAFPPVGTEGER